MVWLANICLLGGVIAAAGQAPVRAPTYQVTHDGKAAYLTAEGERLVSLVPILQVSASSPGIRSKSPLPTKVDFGLIEVRLDAGKGWVLEASAHTSWARYLLSMRNHTGDPRIQTTLRVEYTRAVRVHQEVLRFEAGPVDGAVVLDRAYRFIGSLEPVFANALTPHLVRLNRLESSTWLVGGEGVQGLWLRPRGGRQTWIDLEVDHEANHPFRAFRKCKAKPGNKRMDLNMGESMRDAASSQTVRFDWVVGDMRPLLIGRYPRGFKAAVAFTDHADQSDKTKLEAFAFGREGALEAGELGAGNAGFVNRGLTYTKTIFLRQAGRYAAQFDDSAYRKLLDLMVPRGVEVGVHSASGLRDSMHFSPELLADFRAAYGGRTWIDHQPDTNCESIASHGWRPASRWYMLGLLAANGFEYIANMDDVPIRKGSLNLFLPDWSSARRPIVYPSVRLFSPRGKRFVQFSSSWLFVEPERFLSWFTKEALDRLELERGLMIGHTYFETFGSHLRMRKLSLLERNKDGILHLRSDVDALFARLAARQMRGDLWVTGIEALADHMLPAMRVKVEYGADGSAKVSNSGARPLRGLTLTMPGPVAVALVDGREPIGMRKTPEGIDFWFDLDPGQTSRIRILDSKGKTVRLLSGAKIPLIKEPK